MCFLRFHVSGPCFVLIRTWKARAQAGQEQKGLQGPLQAQPSRLMTYAAGSIICHNHLGHQERYHLISVHLVIVGGSYQPHSCLRTSQAEGIQSSSRDRLYCVRSLIWPKSRLVTIKWFNSFYSFYSYTSAFQKCRSWFLMTLLEITRKRLENEHLFVYDQ